MSQQEGPNQRRRGERVGSYRTIYAGGIIGFAVAVAALAGIFVALKRIEANKAISDTGPSSPAANAPASGSSTTGSGQANPPRSR